MKSKIAILIISIFLLISLIGCDFLIDDYDHTCSFSSWETTVEATCRNTGEQERYCYFCFETETRIVKKKDHTPTEYLGMEPTCTEAGRTAGTYCEECNGIISGIKDIDPFGHTVVTDPAVDPANGKPGRTEGSHCSTCGVVIVKQQSIFSGDYSNPDKYHGEYGYESLSKLQNAASLLDFYNELDLVVSDFHDSLNDANMKKNDENNTYYLAEVVYSDNGISTDEAFAVYSAYMKDHPLYYWMSKQITYTNDYLSLIVDSEYADGEVREEINISIYNKVKEYVEYLNGETNIYNITLGLHDVIIEGANYAYMPDGKTPSRETSANNILGVLIEGKGVCESYAKAFQLILNYCGIDNIYVTGYAGEAHGWNLVQLDDGRWYWYDLTWDDQAEFMLGVSHNYFCVSNSDLVDWKDGGAAGSKTFLDDHTPAVSTSVGINYAYPLPEASDTPYISDGLMLRDQVIELDGLSYVLVGFNKLCLVKIDKAGDVVIPESIEYDGTAMEISCIAKYDSENGILFSGSVIYYDQATNKHLDVTSIYIPKTVKFIWNYAFDHCKTIERFDVSEDNPVFTSVDDILFTKSLYTLIKYPLAKTGMTYTVPSQTVEIAFGAFGDGGNIFCPKYLRRLTIPNTVEVIGAVNNGRGYRDSRPADPSRIVYLDGYIDRLRLMLGYGLITH